ncbi:MAG TPA: tetratricopeptide repeat protein [Burkholderiales bacterium]|nr:tetratricopeptide repeat protein [Burkholderiales bacterium]
MTNAALERFRTLVDRPDETIDLAEAALAIAQQDYPDLEPRRYLDMLGALALEVSRSLPAVAEITDRIAALNRHLFGTLRFRGNDAEYYDPRNSFLNQVLDRRTGIPITLSVVYLEVGWRLGLPLEGVSFPGHFLVKCEVQEGVVVLDPFDRGRSVGVDELKRRLTLVHGRAVTEEEVVTLLTTTATRKDILARLLRNLKAIYLNRPDYAAALAVVERILMVHPDEPAELRDRGIIFQSLECFRAARDDLERYLQLVPQALDAGTVRERLAEVSERVVRLN